MKALKELYDENGKYITDDRYQEILKLDAMLVQKGIPHTLDKFMDGWQVIYPENGENRVMDAIEHLDSYGREDDLLEIMGLLTPEEQEHDSVLGWLTAQDVCSRIERHWKESK